MIFKAKCFGAHLLGVSLKSEVPKVGFKAFTPQGKLQVLSSSPVVGCCTGHEAYGNTVSQLLLPALIWAPHSFTTRVGVAQLLRE